jgi:IPT/TIG domain
LFPSGVVRHQCLDAAEGVKNKMAGRLRRFFGSFTTPPADRYGSTFGVLMGGLMFILLGALLVSALINLWPVVDRTGKVANQPRDVEFFWGLYTATITKSTGLVLLAVLMGAIGGYIHAATSFVSYTGNRKFKASWGWWYALRAFIGAALGLLAYFALRAGFLSSGTNIDPYGVATISGLTGLFSKQATDKLEEIFNTAFSTGPGIGDDVRGDKLSSSGPTIQTLEPNSVTSGQAPTITVTGSNFAKEAQVQVDGQAQQTSFDSPGKLKFQLNVTLTAAPRTLQVTVLNPGGVRSAAKPLTVT